MIKAECADAGDAFCCGVNNQHASCNLVGGFAQDDVKLTCCLALVWREVSIARRHSEAIRFAQDSAAKNFDGDIEVGDHAANNLQLLPVFFAEGFGEFQIGLETADVVTFVLFEVEGDLGDGGGVRRTECEREVRGIAAEVEVACRARQGERAGRGRYRPQGRDAREI